MEQDKQQIIAAVKELAATDVRKCIQCGRCSASCPAAFKMDLLPNRIVWELSCENSIALLNASAPWQCLSCFACEARCPRGVSLARIMEALRLVHIRQHGGNRLPAESLEHYPDDMPQQLLVAAFRKYNK